MPKGRSSAILAALESVPAERRMTWRMHRVEHGETLSQIAQAFNTPANSIAVANNSLVSTPEAGDLLGIPATFNPDAPTARTASKKAAGRYSPPHSTKAPYKGAPGLPAPGRSGHHPAPTAQLKA